MPSVSKKQERFMAIAARNPEFAKKVGIDPDVAKEWHEKDKAVQDVSTEARVKDMIEASDKLGDFVFLGGTTNGSDWRQQLISLGLEMDYFNPVVEVWSDHAKKLEDVAKESSCLQIYVITPFMTGCYSIAELTESAVIQPACTVVAFLEELDDKQWTEHQEKSNKAVIELVRKHGATVYTTMQEIVDHCNFVAGVLEKERDEEEF